MWDDLKTKLCSLIGIYVFGNNFKCRVGSLRVQDLPTYRVSYQICNLQSYYIILFVFKVESLDSINKTFRCNPFSTFYSESVVIFQQQVVLLRISSLYKNS